jgi:hypothetical protein
VFRRGVTPAERTLESATTSPEHLRLFGPVDKQDEKFGLGLKDTGGPATGSGREPRAALSLRRPIPPLTPPSPAGYSFVADGFATSPVSNTFQLSAGIGGNGQPYEATAPWLRVTS